MNEGTGKQQHPPLVRALGPVDATMIVVGSMIGSGIFITSAESARLSGAPGWVLLAWAFAGLLTITGALCCSELATMMPRAGGVYVFFRETYGPSIGFIYGWTLLLVIQTGTIAAVAIAFAKFLGVFVSAVGADKYLIFPISLGRNYAFSLSTEQLVAVAMILFLTWINTRGLNVGRLIQNTFTFAKTAALIAVIIVGVSLGWNPICAARAAAWWNSWANGWTPQVAQPGLPVAGALALALLFGKSMVGPLFAQTAWTNVTFIGSEVRDPAKNLVRALLVGCGIVVILYLLANISYLALLPFSGIEHAPQNRVAVAAMNAALGKLGAVGVAGIILISTFGCNNGLILSGARVYFAMARDYLFFRKIGTTNRHQVPGSALMAQAVWTVALTLPRTVSRDGADHFVYGNVYTQLLEYIVSADLLFYILLVAAVIVLRRREPARDRPYRMWGYPSVPIISIVLAALLIVDLAFLAPATSGIGILIVLTGVPVYTLWRRCAPTGRSV